MVDGDKRTEGEGNQLKATDAQERNRRERMGLETPVVSDVNYGCKDLGEKFTLVKS